MALPNPSMSFSPFAILTAEEMNNIIENIEALQDWSAFDTGTLPVSKMGDNTITLAKLVQTMFSGIIQSYTQTGDGGGTGYYINLLGLKLCWGMTGTITVSGAGNKTVTFPVGFFSNVRAAFHDKNGSTVYATQQGNPPATTDMKVYFGSGTGTANLYWFAIGT